MIRIHDVINSIGSLVKIYVETKPSAIESENCPSPFKRQNTRHCLEFGIIGQ